VRPSSAKAKGRRLQQSVRDLLLASAPELEQDDIRSTSMGAGGEDLLFSPAARRVYPFSIEAKNQENLNVWAALKQAEENAGTHVPLLCFKRNGTEIYAALKLQDLLKLLKR